MLYFFFNDTATTEIYTLSLHDALPIWTDPGSAANPHASGCRPQRGGLRPLGPGCQAVRHPSAPDRRPHPLVAGDHGQDRKSTRLNSSHANISYAVFCLKKKIYYNTTMH